MAKTKQVPKKVLEEEEEEEVEASTAQRGRSDEEKMRVSVANLYINKSNKRDRPSSPNIGIQPCPIRPPWACPMPGLTAIEMSSSKCFCICRFFTIGSSGI